MTNAFLMASQVRKPLKSQVAGSPQKVIANNAIVCEMLLNRASANRPACALSQLANNPDYDLEWIKLIAS